ncbi:MAG: tetratricopeptide repeat protein [Xanthobacteraceae bacterium]|jgi:Flp pilus assembly protein TadD
MATCVVLLTGCEAGHKTVEWLNTPPASAQAGATPNGTAATPPLADAEPTGSILGGGILDTPARGAAPADPGDDLNLGKRHFRDANYGLAEQYFRRAAEKAPGEARHDAEAWLGLAASYDRLRRFDLADRAYAQALKILGPTPELLNNIGYSYLLRGDYVRAREKLLAARAKDPDSPFVRNNLALLEKSERRNRTPR